MTGTYVDCSLHQLIELMRQVTLYPQMVTAAVAISLMLCNLICSRHDSELMRHITLYPQMVIEAVAISLMLCNQLDAL
ncbi:hypothetical protein DPMN_095024 [Dreissena polymorpha]|uniref:Uncharacterized protein n=1 Tax=Dreissena polymorpha TaxID=45954 RepID=A0A9D4L753_DREPO|nr:hypothetical protein DPMN_095024 [Dreissena polymorpha]